MLKIKSSNKTKAAQRSKLKRVKLYQAQFKILVNNN